MVNATNSNTIFISRISYFKIVFIRFSTNSITILTYSNSFDESYFNINIFSYFISMFIFFFNRNINSKTNRIIISNRSNSSTISSSVNCNISIFLIHRFTIIFHSFNITIIRFSYVHTFIKTSSFNNLSISNNLSINICRIF